MENQGQLKTVEFNSGEILFNEGEKTYHFFIVQDGEVEVFRTADDGKKIPLALVSSGASIGEFAMIDRLPRSATARARTPVKAVMVTEEAYLELLSELPTWATSMMETLVERLRHANEVIRKSKMVDEKLRNEIDSTEYDSEHSSVTEIDRQDDDLPDLG